MHRQFSETNLKFLYHVIEKEQLQNDEKYKESWLRKKI